MVQRLQVDADDYRHACRDLPDVVDPHHDQPALDERGATGVDDRHARLEALDRLLDASVPDGVARQVEVVQDEAADGSEVVRDLAEAVLRGHPLQGHPVPVEGVVDRPGVEPQVAERGLVLRLAEDRQVARQQPHGGVVEMILVPMCHEDRGKPLHDLLRGERQLDGGVADRVGGVLDRGAGARRIEHRIHEQPARRRLQDQRRVAHQGDVHAGFLGDSHS